MTNEKKSEAKTTETPFERFRRLAHRVVNAPKVESKNKVTKNS